MDDPTAHPRYEEARRRVRGWLGADWEQRKIREYLDRGK
jgi:hypothetical protein